MYLVCVYYKWESIKLHTQTYRAKHNEELDNYYFFHIVYDPNCLYKWVVTFAHNVSKHHSVNRQVYL